MTRCVEGEKGGGGGGGGGVWDSIMTMARCMCGGRGEESKEGKRGRDADSCL